MDPPGWIIELIPFLWAISTQSGNGKKASLAMTASSRLSLKKDILKDVKSFKIKLRGDGNKYKLRLRQNNRRASYSHDFKSFDGEWTEVYIQVKDFKPSWRGYSYSDYPALDTDEINSMGLQISDKQEGKFMLEIEYIKAIF